MLRSMASELATLRGHQSWQANISTPAGLNLQA
jgi:hypothetical protein